MGQAADEGPAVADRRRGDPRGGGDDQWGRRCEPRGRKLELAMGAAETDDDLVAVEPVGLDLVDPAQVHDDIGPEQSG